MTANRSLRRQNPPEVGEAKRGRSGHLAYLLRQANALTRIAIDRSLRDLGVTSPQFSALVIIGAYQPLSSAELARLSVLTPQSINVIVRNLETQGAILRTPDPVHGRILNIELTDAGQRLFASCRKRVKLIDARLESLLSNEQAGDIVRAWLVSVATALEN